MVCKNCKIKPVTRLPNNNVQVCKSCFIKYFERKTKHTMAKYRMVEKNDHLGVACSGGKDSTAVLYLANKIFSKRPDIKITAITIDEGIKGYRDLTLKDLRKFCKENKINLEVYSFKKEFGKTLDQMVKKHKRPCTVCGVLRRFLLNTKSKELKVNKLVTGHNLDDEAQSVIMNQFRRNIKASARLGPVTGVVKDPRFVRRIKPFYFLTEKEVKIYAYLKGFLDKYVECPYVVGSYRSNVRDMINDFENKYPGTKHNIISSFIEILPILKKHYGKKALIKECKRCGEPCSQEICQNCKLIEEVVGKKN